MSRAQIRFEKRMSGKTKMTFTPVKRKRKKEDKHVAWLWKKVQGGMQIELVKHNKLTLSHRAFAKLVSLQNRTKNNA